MKRYFIISAILHLVVFTGLYLMPLLFIRSRESAPPPMNLVFIPPAEEVIEEEPTLEPTAKVTPSPEPTDYRSMVGDLAPSLTPTPTATPSKTRKPSATPSLTPTPKEPTFTPTVSPTAVPPTETPLPATSTPTPKPTKKPTETPKPTSTPKPTAKATDTPKPTATAKATDTPGPTHSPTPNPTKQALAKALKDVVGAIKNVEKSGLTDPAPAGKKGVPGGIGSGFGAEGAGNGLRTEVPFGDMAYLGRLRDLLQSNFRPPRSTREGGKRTAVIGFKVLKNGEIVDIEVVESSGHKGIDRAAVRAVEETHQIDPLPSGTSDLGVYCDFVVD